MTQPGAKPEPALPAIRRRWLVGAALVPALLVVAFALQYSHAAPFNVHAPSGLTVWLLLLIVASTIVAALAELFLVSTSIASLVRYPALRTWRNLGAVAVGAAFLLFLAGVVLWVGLRTAHR